MAIAFVSADAANAGGTAQTFTLAFAVSSGSNRLLTAEVTQISAEVAISGATYNGVAMTGHTEGDSGTRRYQFFYLAAPASGTNNLVVTFASAASTPIVSVAEWTGVDQTTPVDTLTNQSANATNWTINFATSPSQVAACHVFTGGTTQITGWTGATERYNENVTIGAGVASATATASITIVATIAQTAEHRGTGFNINPAADTTAITASVGTSTWQGLGATVRTDTVVSANTGTSTWQGLAANVELGTEVSATTATSTWQGLAADIRVDTNIQALVATSTWQGLAANIRVDTEIQALVATSTWQGLAASVDIGQDIQVNATIATSTWQGLAADVQVADTATVGLVGARVFRPRPGGRRVIYGG